MPRLATMLLFSALTAWPADLPDFTKAELKDLGIKPVKPAKDPKTGFVVGGKNATALIRTLKEIAGRSIADLEKDMRPKALSHAGFLGKDERLLDGARSKNDALGAHYPVSLAGRDCM